MVFKESDLLFKFSPEWKVRPFDDHRFYRWSSGLGYRGVDFVGIFRGRLILIEVKNYRRREGMPAEDALQQVRDNPGAFVRKMMEKVEDSLKIIRSVDGYYRKNTWHKWYYRFPVWVQRMIAGRYFWHLANELGQHPAHCQFILWMESDQSDLQLWQQLTLDLNQGLASEISRVEIINEWHNPAYYGIQIKHAQKRS